MSNIYCVFGFGTKTDLQGIEIPNAMLSGSTRVSKKDEIQARKALMAVPQVNRIVVECNSGRGFTTRKEWVRDGRKWVVVNL